MFSAFITWMLHTTLGINPLLCLAVAGPLMFVLGYLIQKFLYKTLKDKNPFSCGF